MQRVIHIRDELVLDAHLDTDAPHILLRREGEPGAVRDGGGDGGVDVGDPDDEME